ncbi:hypothetical protein Pcinc_038997 [Petrolisthes cinctipes]|uniref:Uncharacterized protein n=1 Tax=Petrolisthes cinctipes TaxID=88211 RepID=A0AAE1EJR7_PETCI|nr:hypothetical protein Pcinc_038997 [Petrolisthes cinctipes]
MQMLSTRKKCKVMHLGSNNPRMNYTMSSNKNTLVPLVVAEKEKDLGVITDNELKLSQHIQGQQGSGSPQAYFSSVGQNLYKRLIRPHLEYAPVIWNPALKRDKVIKILWSRSSGGQHYWCRDCPISPTLID